MDKTELFNRFNKLHEEIGEKRAKEKSILKLTDNQTIISDKVWNNLFHIFSLQKNMCLIYL